MLSLGKYLGEKQCRLALGLPWRDLNGMKAGVDYKNLSCWPQLDENEERDTGSTSTGSFPVYTISALLPQSPK